MHTVKYLLVLIMLTGCQTTKYVEKQSESLSQSVYAAGDSVLVGRFDLAEFHIFEAQKLVSPPPVESRIKIKPLFVDR